MTEETPPAHLTDWRGESWTPDSDAPAAHPNSRFCTPIDQIDMLAEEYFSPDGVELSAILFGGRRKTTIPLVTEARDWSNGIFMVPRCPPKPRLRPPVLLAWSAATRWPCCRSSATTQVTT